MHFPQRVDQEWEILIARNDYKIVMVSATRVSLFIQSYMLGWIILRP
jgi:hypothetical protein